MDEFLPWLGNAPFTWMLSFLLLGLPAALATGRGLASTWAPWWQILPYAGLLAAGHRFFDYALGQGDLWAVPGFALAWLLLAACAGAIFRATRAAMMVAQYPWLYERSGPFGWRDKVS